jgi:hypothetical protein
VKRALEIAIGTKTGSTSTDALAAAVRFKSFRASDLEIKVTELSAAPEAESRAAMLVDLGMMMGMIGKLSEYVDHLRQQLAVSSRTSSPAAAAGAPGVDVELDIKELAKTLRESLLSMKAVANPLIVSSTAAKFVSALVFLAPGVAQQLMFSSPTVIGGRSNKTIVDPRSLGGQLRSDHNDGLSLAARKTMSVIASLPLFSPTDAVFLQTFYQV